MLYSKNYTVAWWKSPWTVVQAATLCETVYFMFLVYASEVEQAL